MIIKLSFYYRCDFKSKQYNTKKHLNQSFTSTHPYLPHPNPQIKTLTSTPLWALWVMDQVLGLATIFLQNISEARNNEIKISHFNLLRELV